MGINKAVRCKLIVFILLLASAASAAAQAPKPKPGAGAGDALRTVIQNGHTHSYRDLAFSPDGAWMASAGLEAEVKIWRAADGVLVKTITDLKRGAKQVLYSPDGGRLYTLGWDDIRVWDCKDFRLLSTLPYPYRNRDAGFDSIFFVDGGRTLAVNVTIDDQKLNGAHFYAVDTWKETGFLPNEHVAKAAPAIPHLVTVFDYLRQDYNAPRQYFVRDARSLALLAQSGKGGEFKDVSSDLSCLVVEEEKGERFTILNLPGLKRGFSVTRKELAELAKRAKIPAEVGKNVASYMLNYSRLGRDGMVFKMGFGIYPDLRHLGAYFMHFSIREAAFIRGQYNEPEPCQETPDGSLLVARDEKGGFSLLDAGDLSVRTAVPSNRSVPLTSLSFLDNGRRFAVCDYERGIQLYSPAKGFPDGLIPMQKMLTLGFNADSSLMAAGGDDPSVTVTSLADKSRLAALRGLRLPAKSLVFSADSKRLLGTGDGVLEWDIGSGKVNFYHHLPGRGIWVAARYSPDGRYLAAVGGDMYGGSGTVGLWKLPEFEPIFLRRNSPESYSDLLFTRDGKTFMVFGGSNEQAAGAGKAGCIEVYGLKNEAPLRTIRAPAYVSTAAFSPDGQNLATTEGGGMLRLRRAKDLKETAVFKDPEGSSSCVSWSADGRFLYSLSGENSIRVLRIASGASIALISFLGGDWFVSDEEGRFDCSDTGRKYIKYVSGTTVYECDQFWKEFYTPDLAARFLQGEKFSKLAAALPKAAAGAPLVTIVNPSKGFTTDNGQLIIRVSAKAGRGGLGRIRLLLNGSVLDEKNRGLSVVQDGDSKEFGINLLEGLNRLVGSALDGAGASEGRSLPIDVVYKPARSQRPDMYLICAGVSSYKDKDIRQLGSPRDDAAAIGETFKRVAGTVYGAVNTIILTDKAATVRSLLKTFGDVSAKVRPSDTVILFLAGHGITVKNNYYFLTWESDLADLENSALSVQEIKDFIGALPANKRALFLDTCQSGSAVKAIGVAAMSRGIEDRYLITSIGKEKGMAIFSAAGESEAAWEIKELGHGLFTYYLLEALTGRSRELARNGVLSIGGVLDFVNRSVRDGAMKYLKTEQKPIMYNFGDNFSLGLVK